MQLIDAHVHLQDPLIERDIDRVMEQCAAAGIARLVCNGSCEDDWFGVALLAARFPAIVPCFGLHPWHVARRSPQWTEDLRGHLQEMPSAVGEIGLDRWVEPRDEPDQERVFREQLEIAAEFGRPVMVHCLRAWGWLMDIMRRHGPPPAGMLIHAYGGSVELVAELASMGAYFSFAGTVLEDQREKAREALCEVPADRLLVETDAPDMLPPAHARQFELTDEEGQIRNHPANLATFFPRLAAIRRTPAEAMARSVWANAGRLLGRLVE